MQLGQRRGNRASTPPDRVEMLRRVPQAPSGDASWIARTVRSLGTWLQSEGGGRRGGVFGLVRRSSELVLPAAGFRGARGTVGAVGSGSGELGSRHRSSGSSSFYGVGVMRSFRVGRAASFVSVQTIPPSCFELLVVRKHLVQLPQPNRQVVTLPAPRADKGSDRCSRGGEH